MSEGRKDDQGKLRWGLLRRGCVLALESVIRVLMYGAKKYGDDNWKAVENAERRYRDALDRHLADIDRGVEIDKDTGEDNWAHVATNALFVLQLREARKAVGQVVVKNRAEEDHGWHPNTGKAPAELTVDVKFRNGNELSGAFPGGFRWSLTGLPGDIVVWRRAKPYWSEQP